MYHLLFLYIFIFFISFQMGTCQQGDLQSDIRISKVYTCNSTRLKWDLQNVSIIYSYPGSYINAIANVTEETKKLKMVYIHLDRCNDQGFNCEDFQTWHFDNFCTILTWTNQMWNGILDHIQPPFRCPIKKAVYEIRNASYNINAVNKWYPDYAKYHWKVETKVLNERNEFVFCAVVESHLYQYRKRNRNRKP